MTISQRIERLLLRRGPMTARAIATELDEKIDSVRHVLKEMRADDPKRVHVYDWVFETNGQAAPSAMFKLGDDIDEPVPERSEIKRVAQGPSFYGVTSVFDLGSGGSAPVIEILEKNLSSYKHSVD